MTFTLKCVGYNAGERCFTIGKTYEFKDGNFYSDRDFNYKHWNESNSTPAGVIEWFSPWYKFELVSAEKIVITHDYKTTTATLYRGDEKVVATARCAPEDKFDFMVGAKLAMERLAEKTNEVVVNGVKVGDRVNINGHNGTVICINNLNCLGVEFDTYMPVLSHSCGGNTLLSGNTGTFGKCDWFSAYDKVVKHGEVPEYYNGKVVCVKSPYRWWTVGKVYEVKDGYILSDPDEFGYPTKYPKSGEEPYRDAEDVRHAGHGESRRHNSKNEFIPLIEE